MLEVDHEVSIEVPSNGHAQEVNVSRERGKGKLMESSLVLIGSYKVP